MPVLPEESIGVLIVDDDASVLRSWREILKGKQYRLFLLEDPEQALQVLETQDVDVAVVDIRMPTMDGMELLSLIKTRRPAVEVVMMTGYGGVQDAVEAIKRGAYDFLGKPFESLEAAELSVRRAAERRLLERRLRHLEKEKRDERVLRGMVGQSQAIKRVIDLVRNVAASSATVLIYGESGTGKELVARALHEDSPRHNRSLVTLNCSALTETLLESELFGHARGAFTGASASHQGLFEAADGGTLFLDEIGDMSLATQVKLLRTLQEGEVRPVGATRTVKVNVRVIAATNVDLEERCRAGLFRQDLYYRLNVVRIDVPPLRERNEDIPLLAHHFLLKYQERSSKTFAGIDPPALRCLSRYSWPGNVRELENVLERAVILARGPSILVEDLPPRIAGERADASAEEESALDELSFAEAKAIAVERFERIYLTRLLEVKPTITAAAQAAGLNRSNFKRLLRRHGLQRLEREAGEGHEPASDRE